MTRRETVRQMTILIRSSISGGGGGGRITLSGDDDGFFLLALLVRKLQRISLIVEDFHGQFVIPAVLRRVWREHERVLVAKESGD